MSKYAIRDPDLPEDTEQGHGEEEKPRVDWIVVPLLVSMFTGFAASVLDFVLLQKMVIQIHWLLVGVPLLVIGTVVKIVPRNSIVQAGFGSVKSTLYLHVVRNQRLVTDGLYRYVRHPIYSGDIIQKYGWVAILSSIYGLVFVTIGVCCYLIRIRNEERMLVAAFGEEYKKYQRTTKKLVPYVY